MYNAVFDLPEHMSEAIRLCAVWKLNPEEFADARNIVVAGMGGSAIAGDLAATLLRPTLLVPFNVHRHYVLPEYVDDESLVISSSYSGNTDETIAATEDALRRKAMMAAISTGGLLKDICELNEVPLCQIPEGLQPRAALGYSFACLMLFCEKIGLIKDYEAELKETIAGLQKYREVYIEDSLVETNTAKSLALRLHGKTAVIYSGPSLTDGAGLRLKGQICENGKQLAWANQFPEFNHNEIEGWNDRIGDLKDKLAIVILRDAEDIPQIRLRMNVVRDQIKELGVDVIELHSKGKSRTERMFSLIQLGDFASYYLALLNDADPTPVPAIESLKQQMSEANLPRR
jgi:glucose/mannose-6-phosphate isomerase